MARYPGIDTTFHFPDYPSSGRSFGGAGYAPGTSGGGGAECADGAVFHVWAPLAEKVVLAWRAAPDEYGAEFIDAHYREAPLEAPELTELGFRTETAARLSGGWWAVQQPSGPLAKVLTALAAGQATVLEYGFLLDEDSALRPDPRSRRQPYGPHGPSATVLPVDSDLSEPEPTGAEMLGGAETLEAAGASGTAKSGGWNGRAWDSSPIYELHIGTFTPVGTFDSAIDRLDHLVQLGVGWVELLPVNTFAGLRNWGYDGVAWYAIQESYGGPEGYRRFIDAAHARGLGVIQDVVYNHLGPSGNYLGTFGPYLHAAAANPWGDSMNLDGPQSDEVRAYILDNMAMFVSDYGVDAFRLDAVHAFVDTRAVHLVEDMAIHMEQLAQQRKHPVWLIAESDMNSPSLITSRSAGGDGLTAQWSDDYHHALHVALTGETTGYYADFAAPEALAKVLQHGFFHDGTYSSFRERGHGRPIDESRVSPGQLVVCAQNHDQVGNRAAGERLSQLVGLDNIAVGAALLMLGPNTPMIFMGEEWAASSPWQFFTDHREEWLGEAVSEGRKSEFARMGWEESAVPDPQDPAAFERSVLDWSEFGADAEADPDVAAGFDTVDLANVPRHKMHLVDAEVASGIDETSTATRRAAFELFCELGRLRAQRPEFRSIRFSDVTVGRAAEGRGHWIAVFIGTFGVVANFGTTAQAVLLPRSAEEIVLDTSQFLFDHWMYLFADVEQGAGFQPAELRDRAVVLQPMTAVALQLKDEPDEVEELRFPGA